MKELVQIFSDKVFILTFFFSVAIELVGFVSGKSQSIPFGIADTIVVYSGLGLVLKHSSLIYEHRHIRVMYVCASIILMGALFKLESWSYSSLLLSAGLAGIAITYLFRFFSKKNKNALDISKAVWLTTHISFTIVRFESLPGASFLFALDVAIFFLMMGFFFYRKREILLKSFNS